MDSLISMAHMQFSPGALLNKYNKLNIVQLAVTAAAEPSGFKQTCQ